LPVKITGITSGSYAQKYGVNPGDMLISINKNIINDVLDYQFYITEPQVSLILQTTNGQRAVNIKKGEYEDIGLQFETYLMDEQKGCENACIFCFIDQLPPGMRKSLYFKDDDSRLSFLLGNYITLTNLTEADVERIIKMRISPVNISVHTTNLELRVSMMGNPKAGTSLDIIKKFAENGIKMNCQLVLCRGVNDGDELTRSINDLAALYPAVESIAAVPAGLTKYRDKLHPIKAYDKASSADIVTAIEKFGNDFYAKTGDRLVYPADEFFLKAELPIPDDYYYGDFSQLENGVGMWALLKNEFLENAEKACCHCGFNPQSRINGVPRQARNDSPISSIKHKSVATSVSAYELIKSLVDYAGEKWHNVKCDVYKIKNDFFGEQINVAGLITGQDLAAQLAGKPLGGELLIPATMLRSEGDVFLDDITVEELSKKLGVKITPVPPTGKELFNAIINE